MDENTLSADELKFFETGELPAALAPATDPVVDPIVDPAAAADPAPAIVPPQVAPVAPQIPDHLQQSLQVANQRYQSLEAQIGALTNQLKSLTTAPEPDAQTDPIGAITHKLQQLHNELNGIKQSSLQTTQQQAYNAFINNIRDLRTEFATKTPDFTDAYNHLRTVRSEDFRMFGTLESDIPNALLQEELQIAQSALQNGKNPAQVIYDLAKRHGYTPKSTPAVATPQVAADKLAQLKSGQEAAKNVPRAGIDNTLTLDALKDASNEDLDKLVTNEDAWHKLVGGRALGKSIF